MLVEKLWLDGEQAGIHGKGESDVHTFASIAAHTETLKNMYAKAEMVLKNFIENIKLVNY